MKLAWPAQNVAIQTDEKQIDPTWYDRLKIVQAVISGNIIGEGLLATGATTGFAYLPTCAGAPTGTPVTKAGYVASVYDLTNHKLWIYDTGTHTWKGVVVT